MFQDLSEQNNQQNSAQIPVQRVFDDPNQNQVVSDLQQGSDDDMHYMPDKFLTPIESKKESKNMVLVLVIALLGLVLLGVGGFAFYTLVLNKPQKPVDNSLLNLEPSQNSTTTEQSDVKEELKTAFDRDKKRIEDITTLRSALSMYFQDVKKYPNTLDDLGKYLKEIPKNPTPGGEEYVYEVNANNSNYKILFILEEGGSMGDLALLSGKYQAKPDIVESYSEEMDNSNNDSNDNENTSSQATSSDTNVPVVASKGIDADDDGLTDKEENLFDTKVDDPDTDKDNYKDGEEVLNLYDPTDPKNKIVNNASLVKVYINKENLYSLLYPAKWTYDENDDKSQVNFKGDKDQDFVKVDVEDNPQDMNPKAWYINTSPSANPNDLESFVNKNEVFGIKSKDGYTVYVFKNKKVYIISYIMVNRDSLEYGEVFNMMIQSFRLNSK